MSSSFVRRGARGVRFAADDEMDASNIAITMGDARSGPLQALLAGGGVGNNGRSSPHDPMSTPAEHDGPGGPDAPSAGLLLGGLRILHDEMSQDDAYATSRGDSDADGPMDGLRRAVSASAADGLRGAGGGAEPGLTAHSGGGAATVGVRRHHRAVSGKPGKNKQGKQAVMRTWLRIDKGGETSILQADKWRITHKLGIQTRDLRLLDPNLSTTYPSAILCRDKAIVVNLEHLKAIITTSFVLVVNPGGRRGVALVWWVGGGWSTRAEANSTVSTTGSRSSDSSSSASSDSSVEEAETAVVEMLLETYFMHLDNTYNKLQTLHEYIGDTEDLVNIKLDQHRNQLITIDLVLTAFTTVLAMMTVVGAWFGMNLDSRLQEAPGVFMQVVVSSTILGLAVLVCFVFWLWRAKLIIY
ncbi:Magnesium transporter MRS2-10 [Tetrabaena socialis]|uniref:Magnesium transporter n=1 Tax=Tetrabaena socialis TaxID=47790 RepID=A0A2J7ZME7_9CHLO|nr:Magnesium transporter MRS2-10 [Tetrabaena socialis]|eukprot:PNH01435.1 Magnesium transporter MRS2-10 [Tetrabaena socialis]